MGTPNSILIIDPRPARVRVLRKALGEDYEFTVAYDLESCTKRIEEGAADLIVIADEAAGDALVPWLQKASSVIPTPIIVTADREWSDEHVVSVLNAGAAYHLDWSDPIYLAAVARRALERVALVKDSCGGRPSGVEDFGDIAINYDRHRVTVSGRSVKLRPREWQLLTHIASYRGAPAPLGEITRHIWGERATHSKHHSAMTARVYIGYLRHKLGAHRILTEPYVGYRLAMEAS